ncbi:MAG: hypothetical protein Q7V31_13645 [Parvibaculum sp.]|uniref:hypothetical protein n=1 Tax=Parvibaculum sp. TaxID=2024848 RepID=UPI00271AB7EA|nr:hypothetical protein [Parvibaculum sp.]MDO8839963.1 hypothetical protein [Parvibaculum sp.]
MWRNTLHTVALTLFAIGSASAHAANPYEVFRLGMTADEVRSIFAEHDGEIIEESNDNELMLGRMPSREPAAATTLVFRDGRLRLVIANYDPVIRFDEPKMTTGWCEENFVSIRAGMETVFGKSEPLVWDESDADVRSAVVKWKSARGFVMAVMSLNNESCVDLYALLFDGSEEELMEGIERR